MTARVKELTDRAKPDGGDGALPTFAARDVQVLVDALDRLGYATDAGLARAGVRRLELQDPDARVPCTAYGAILESAQGEGRAANLALEVASVTRIGAYPLLDYLVLTAANVGEALHQLVRFLRLTAAPVQLEIEDLGSRVRLIERGPGNPFAIEYSAFLCVLHLRHEASGRLDGLSVHFQHRPGDTAELARRLGCPVHAEAGWDGVEFPRAACQVPLKRSDRVLRELLERQAAETAPSSGSSSYTADVRRALVSAVAGDSRIETVARRLGASARTLQRRLAAEGSSYQDLLDRARRDAAEGYLADARLSVGEIAYLLGYSEPAALHRAFKRWYGMTPLAYRRRRRPPPQPVSARPSRSPRPRS